MSGGMEIEDLVLLLWMKDVENIHLFNNSRHGGVPRMVIGTVEGKQQNLKVGFLNTVERLCTKGKRLVLGIRNPGFYY